MKYIPILFSTPMVQARIRGKKTQTRRTKGLEELNHYPDSYMYHGFINEKHHFSDLDTLDDISLSCPYGQIGDVLWVRETWNKDYRYFYFKASPETLPMYIRAGINVGDWSFEECKWKPSIHMPKEACRIFLRITNVRVERLKDISQREAWQEGVESLYPHYRDYTGNQPYLLTGYASFKSLWQSINGPESWNKNPWVWVIEFEQIQKPKSWPN